jgi:hypothetical protein
MRARFRGSRGEAAKDPSYGHQFFEDTVGRLLERTSPDSFIPGGRSIWGLGG